jgi:hypothetical protein
MWPQSLELKSKQARNQQQATCCLRSVGFWLGLYFNPEIGGDMFLLIVG